jgi:glutamate racemase
MHIISSETTTSAHNKDQLAKKKLLMIKKNSLNDIFYVSDKLQKFNNLAKIFLNNKSIKVQKIIL